MNQVLPFVILGAIILFIFAFIKGVKKQKQAASLLFKEFADSHGWKYEEKDSGIIQRLAKDFQGIGIFSSPSLGKITPKTLMLGSIPEGQIYFFQHSVRVYQGYAFKFYVFLLQPKKPVHESVIIRFKKGKKKLSNTFYTDSEIIVDKKWSKDILVYGNNQNSINRFFETINLLKLIKIANELPWRVDLQIKNNCYAIYLAERNADLENNEDITRLLDFTKETAKILVAK